MKEWQLLMVFGGVLLVFFAGNVQGKPEFDDLQFPEAPPSTPTQGVGLINPSNHPYPAYGPYGLPLGNPYLQLPYNLSSSPDRYNIYPYEWLINPNNRVMQPKRAAQHTKKSWGDTRYIWPDIYTDFTGDAWDKMINAPYELGYLPGGWRFPSFSSPDPVTVGDAVANQVPPIVEEIPNFMNFTN